MTTLVFVSLFCWFDCFIFGLEVTNGMKALLTSEKAPLSIEQLHGFPIGLIVSLGNAELKDVKLEEEQVIGFSFTNKGVFD